jgi:hypothetical protein
VRGVVGVDLGRGLGFERGGPAEQRVVGSGRACVVGVGGGHGHQDQSGIVVVDGGASPEAPPHGRAAAKQ